MGIGAPGMSGLMLKNIAKAQDIMSMKKPQEIVPALKPLGAYKSAQLENWQKNNTKNLN